MHYAVRSRKDAAYLDRLPESKTTLYAKRDGNRPSLASIIPAADAEPRASVYCCGPSSLLVECRRLTEDLGYPRA